MQPPNYCRILQDPVLNLAFCEAFFSSHNFPPHSHDYYVVGAFLKGGRFFSYRGRRYHVPAGGMVIFEPEAEHRCGAGENGSFVWRAVYPTRAQLQEAADGLCGGRGPLRFPRVCLEDPELLRSFNALHWALRKQAPEITREALFVRFMTLLLSRHSDRGLGREFDEGRVPGGAQVVRKARAYLEQNLVEPVGLEELARHVGSDRYRLTRAFNRELGLAPHQYLDCLRVRRAQSLLAAGMPPAEVAAAAGFTDQSHLTKRFKRQIGVTPGQYLR